MEWRYMQLQDLQLNKMGQRGSKKKLFNNTIFKTKNFFLFKISQIFSTFNSWFELVFFTFDHTKVKEF